MFKNKEIHLKSELSDNTNFLNCNEVYLYFLSFGHKKERRKIKALYRKF